LGSNNHIDLVNGNSSDDDDTTPQLSSRFCRLGQTGKCDGATVTDENDECEVIDGSSDGSVQTTNQDDVSIPQLQPRVGHHPIFDENEEHGTAETVDIEDESDLELDSKEDTEAGELNRLEDDDEWCDGCAFVHYFMLEELPKALGNVERNAANAKSLDSAIEYLKDAHEKFVLYQYQAHVLRVVNQNIELAKRSKELCDLCCEEKNSTPLHLWLVIDFKMKWEAMYSRETTVKNYGKRGISWHGNRVHTYVWDQDKAKPVKVVSSWIKFYKDGTNKME